MQQSLDRPSRSRVRRRVRKRKRRSRFFRVGFQIGLAVAAGLGLLLWFINRAAPLQQRQLPPNLVLPR